MFETRVVSYIERSVCSSSRAQIKDSGLTSGVHDEKSPFLAVQESFRLNLKNSNKRNAFVYFPLIFRVLESGLQVHVGSFLEQWVVIKLIPFKVESFRRLMKLEQRYAHLCLL